MDKKKLIWLAAAVIWMVMIFYFSNQKATESSEISGGITYRLAEKVGQLSVFDWEKEEILHYGQLWEHPVRKAAHMTEYAILAVILLGNFSQYGKTKRQKYILAQTLAVCYAASDEFHQRFIEGRSGEFKDVCIDGAGAFLGLLLAWGILTLWNRRKERGKIA